VPKRGGGEKKKKKTTTQGGNATLANNKKLIPVDNAAAGFLLLAAVAFPPCTCNPANLQATHFSVSAQKLGRAGRLVNPPQINAICIM
jgi:hypothetical protein